MCVFIFSTPIQEVQRSKIKNQNDSHESSRMTTNSCPIRARSWLKKDFLNFAFCSLIRMTSGGLIFQFISQRGTRCSCSHNMRIRGKNTAVRRVWDFPAPHGVTREWVHERTHPQHIPVYTHPGATGGSGPKSAIQLLLSGGFCNIKGRGRNEISKINPPYVWRINLVEKRH
jgi:hypothetical protein